MAETIRVGIIGASPERGWAQAAHVPALAALSGLALSAVATTRRATAEAAAAAYGAARAHDDWRALIADPAVDAVAVCVKVAHHRDMVLAALAAGKPVFCEWPLGLTTAEAVAMQQAADAAGVPVAIGLQGRVSPHLAAVRALVAEGAVGEVISATLVSSLANWGPKLPPAEAYRTRVESGATGLTVPGGHTLDSLVHVLGPFASLSALVTTQTPRCEIVGTGEVLDVTAPDEVLVAGRLASGAAVSVHVKADMANPEGVLFQINGTRGDIRVTTRAPVGPAPVGIQRADLLIEVARGRRKPFVAIEDLSPFLSTPEALPEGPPLFTGQLWARFRDAIRGGAPMVPDFATAVAAHRLLDAVQAASDTGQRQRPVA
jgi:predicted dehydrogenase